ncbi:MAG: c-type cytochrome [Planctomycetota bacterium]
MKLSDLDLDFRLPKPPMVLVAVMMIGAFVPLGVASAIWFKRNYFDPNPRIHIFQDMDNQAKGKAQSHSEVFVDGRTMREYVPGTVAWGRSANHADPDMLKDDDLAYRGAELSPETGELETTEDANGNVVPKFLDGYPDIVEVDQAFIKRGHEQYMIHCYTCHGADGRGLGPTKRAMDVLATYDQGVPDPQKTGTTPLIPANLVTELDADQKPIPTNRFAPGTYANGKMFNVITKGQGTMNGLGPMIKVKDRWAIIAYVRAMQESQRTALTAEANAETE